MIKKKNVLKKEDMKSIKSAETKDEEMTSPEVVGSDNDFSFRGLFRKKFIIGLVIGLVVALAIVVAAASFMFYGNPGKYLVLEKIAAAFHFPMAKANGQYIAYSDFYNEYKILNHYYNQQVKLGAISANQVPPDSQNRKDLEEQLISKTLIEQLARKYKIVVTDIEIEQSWTKDVLPYFDNDEKKAEEKIKEDYNMSVSEFKEKMIRENLLYNKVDEIAEMDPDVQEFTRVRAEGVLKEVKDGKQDFAALVKQYSDDTGTKANGGDLDWFGKGQMVSGFEEAAFKLQPGEISDLVKTIYGYHIIKVAEKKGSAEGGDEQIKASHILIKPSLATYLQEVKDSDSIKRYIDFK
ncbi:MAG: peptidylprolyl isomerase [Patescibacteria group bacterium]|jgi:foldase protein PrsA